MSTEKQREAFEAAYLEKYPWRKSNMGRTVSDGEYLYDEVRIAWKGFQMAMNSLPVEAIKAGIDALTEVTNSFYNDGFYSDERREAVKKENNIQKAALRALIEQPEQEGRKG